MNSGFFANFHAVTLDKMAHPVPSLCWKDNWEVGTTENSKPIVR